MKVLLIIGIVIVIVGLFFGLMMEGFNVFVIINFLVMLIVFCGMFGVMIIGVNFDVVKLILKFYMMVFNLLVYDFNVKVFEFVGYVEFVCCDGLLVFDE